MKKLAHFAALGLALLLLQACGASGPSPEEVMTGSWKVQRIEQPGMPNPSLSLLMESSFTFQADGRYEIMLGDLSRGEWHLSDDDKMLITKPDGGMEQEIDLVQVDSSKVVLENRQAQPPLRIELVPVDEWQVPTDLIPIPNEPILEPMPVPGDSNQ